ncbi:MucBP domain-containing protein [Streptococcus sp. 2022WUSS135]
MRKANKKSFDWYGTKQQFSIRKYHFGAASVLLGMSLVMGAGAQTVKAEETAASSDATTASSTSVDSLNADAKESVALPTETAASSERTVDISYIVKYVLEDGSVVSASVESVPTTTTEAIAKATATVTAVVPEGYELASGESATVLYEVTENAENIVTVKVVKKVEATATVSTQTTTSTTVATASSTTTAATSTTPTTPATVEEAKTVLEQVTSEAEVLANEANRLVAADSTNEALKTAAAATKLVVTEATVVLNDSTATLESVNAQINAVRTNVEALVLELRKYYPDGEITAVLNTAAGTPAATTIDVTNPNSIHYAQNGVWEIPNPAKAANSGLPVADQKATITEADRKYPDGYIGDQDANRDTFLILNLDTVAGYGDGQNFNDWVNHNYYITFSVSTDAAERASEDVVYAKLVEKTDNGNNVVRTIKLSPGVANNFEELKVLEGDATHKTTYSFVYNVQTANGGTTRTISTKNSNGSNKNTILYSKLEPKRVGETFTTADVGVTGSTTQTTSYFVKENADTGRPRELLAKYAQKGGLIGDKFTIAGVIDFDNYELIKSELPSVTSGVLASDYVVGTQILQLQPNNNEVRVVTITGADGSVQQQLYMLDPNNPDWAKFYKSNMNKATLSDLKDYFKLMFTSEVLKPGAYNTKEGTFSAKFYEADKLVLENTIVQVLDENGNVLGTLSDDKSTITTNTGTTISVASATDSSVIGTDETVYLLNYHKVYKTDTNGNYVDAAGNVLTPILWDVYKPANEFVPGIYEDGKAGVDSVTISTGPLNANSYPEAIWYFGYNYKTAAGEKRLVDTGVIPGATDDSRWDLGGLELGMRNNNSKNEQHARYWYTEKGGVEVYYITSDGKVLTDFTISDGKTVADKVTIVGHGDTDSAYNTASVRYPTITAADGTVYYYKQIDTTAANLHPVVNDTTDTDYRSNEKIDAETGTIKTDTVKQLTYVYEKAGSVNVNFVDVNGKVIKAPVSDEKDAKPGYNYDTDLDQKLASITFEGKVYKLVPAGDYPVGKVGKGNNLIAVGNNTAKGIDPTTGKIEAGVNKEVTYVYKAVTGSVVVNYKDTEGNVIKDPETDVSDAPVGDAYTTTDKKPNEIVTKDGSRYVLVPSKTDGEENGKVIEGTITVTYVYQKVANWIPEIPNVPESERPKVPYPFDPTEPDEPIDPTIPGTNGEIPNIPYVPGYTPVDPKDSTPLEPVDPNDPGKGYVPPTPENPGVDTPIPYVPVKKVVTNHVDEEGNPVAPQEEGTKPNKSIPGYEFTGKTVTDEDGNTTHIYKKTPEVKNGTVVVNYVTEDGTVIKDSVTDTPTSPEGTPYDTTDNKPKTITFKDEEYELVRVDGTENGKVVEGETVVTYVYRKVETPAKKVVTNHVDEEGNPVAPQEEGTKPNKSIPGYEFTGKTVTDEDGNTTHIYKKTPEVKNGTVVVNYVTEDGTVIKAPVTDTPTSPEGTLYDTTDNKPKTITFKDEEYELVRVDGTENGKVVEGETVVTYVYRKVETPAKKVVTNHVDEEGNPVAPQEEGTKPNKSIPGYEFTGKTVTDEDGNTTHIYKKTPAKKVVTNHVDEEGNPVAPKEDGSTPKRQISGYEYVRTVVDEEGNTTHIYRKLSNKPTTPEKETPAKPQAGKTASGKAQLPNTGEASSVAGALGTAMLVATLAFARKRRRNED